MSRFNALPLCALLVAAAAAPAMAQDSTTAAGSGHSWASLDTNGDGNLNKQEAAAHSTLAGVFDQADSNADGELSGQEYSAYLAANATPETATSADAAEPLSEPEEDPAN
jgi:hypothetical protein